MFDRLAFFSAPPLSPNDSTNFFLSASEGRTSKLIVRLRFASTLFFAFIFLGIVQSISAQTVVLYASQAPVKVGNWSSVGDTTAAGSFRLSNPDQGAAKISNSASLKTDKLGLREIRELFVSIVKCSIPANGKFNHLHFAKLWPPVQKTLSLLTV